MGKEKDSNVDDMQREMLSQQKFTMEGAISRAGAGLMKGESPISSQDQAISILTQWIDQQVSDPSGALKSVLCRQVRNNELLLGRHQKNPLSALQEMVDKILASNFVLHEFVRQIDVRWGELNQERPLFQLGGQSPDPADEYTHESVRVKLVLLLKKLQGEIDRDI
jgi:hypothetical protein